MEQQIEILELIQAVARQLFSDDFSEKEDTQAILLEKIRLRNIELHLALNDFIFALESMNFIATDYQLRLKAADIWKQQNEMFLEVLRTRATDLKALATANGLNINERIDKLTD